MAMEKAILPRLEAARGIGRAEKTLMLVSVSLKATDACRAHETRNRKPAIAQRF
jgi:hypothetical protein